jgi:hypothetical protein
MDEPVNAKPLNTEKLKALGMRLAQLFKRYESDRRPQEQKWQRNLNQFLGEYDPEVAKTLDKERSKAYPRLTRVKVVSMLSRLMNLLFPTTEKNWGVDASPVPNLSVDDLNAVLQTAMQTAQQTGAQLSDEIIESAVIAFAKQRAQNLSREVEDQLAEIGGNRNLNYVALCRKVIFSSILYGVGVLKGPFVRSQKQRTWIKSPTGTYTPYEFTALRPQFEFVPVWDYYPDMSAKSLSNMDGQFQRMVLAKPKLRELADRDDFFGDAIKAFIESTPNGNWSERQHETERRTQGVSTTVNTKGANKYEVLVWEGYVSRAELEEIGVELPDTKLGDLVDASVWLLGDVVIKCVLSPWAELEPDQRVQQYHHFVFEEDDTNLIGNGLPNIMRDSQMGLAAAVRMMFDNASVTCGPNLEVNTSRLAPDMDDRTIQAYKVWRRDDEGAESQYPAVREIKFDSHLQELKLLADICQGFADQETFVNPATGGDMQKGPSEPFRSAAGASLMLGNMALPFKDAVRNYDNFTISVINSIVLFNRHFNPNKEVQGDFTPIARGSSSLMAKEVRGMALDMMAQTVQPEERKYVNWYALLRERLAVRDVDVSGVVKSEQDAKAADAAEAAKAAEDADSMRQLLAAEVRKLLADSVKSLTAADSNAASADQKMAAAEAAKYTAILQGLLEGLGPKDVHAAHMGADVPQALIDRADAKNAPKEPAKKEGAKA